MVQDAAWGPVDYGVGYLADRVRFMYFEISPSPVIAGAEPFLTGGDLLVGGIGLAALVVAIAAAVFAGWSALISWQVRKDVAVWKLPVWSLVPVLPVFDPTELRLTPAVAFDLVNTGETPARDVSLVFAADPTNRVFRGREKRETTWSLVDGKGGRVRIEATLAPGADDEHFPIRALIVFDEEFAGVESSSFATVTFNPLRGKAEPVRLPIPRFAGEWSRAADAWVHAKAKFVEEETAAEIDRLSAIAEQQQRDRQ